MSRLAADERALMMRLPQTDIVGKAGSSAERGRLALVSSLRQRGLIDVKLDPDASMRGQVVRKLSLTPAGITALHGGA